MRSVLRFAQRNTQWKISRQTKTVIPCRHLTTPIIQPLQKHKREYVECISGDKLPTGLDIIPSYISEEEHDVIVEEMQEVFDNNSSQVIEHLIRVLVKIN